MPRITTSGAIAFECEICHFRKDGLPEDTLWFEEASVHEEGRFQIYLERASHDLAGKTVPILCKCGRQYMTLVRIGKASSTLYVCECGERLSANELMDTSGSFKREGALSSAETISAPDILGAIKK